MKIAEMNWSQVEEYLKRDDRAVLPLGSTEQHAHLSLAVDCHPVASGSRPRPPSRWACRSSRRGLWHHPLFPGLSRHGQPAARDLCRPSSGTSSTA